MQKRYIAPAIMLAAGAITSIFNIINGVELLEYLKSLLIVLILFYIIGKIVTLIITKVTINENGLSDIDDNIQPEESQDEISEDIADIKEQKS